MIKIAIVDDNMKFCELMQNTISEYATKNQLDFDISVFYSGESLISEMKSGIGLDIVFLDIEMAEMNGVQVGQSIRKELDLFTTQIVYVTSHESYASQLFQNQPFGFIVKPINTDKVYEVLDEYRRQYGDSKMYYEYLSNKKHHKIDVDEIIYVSSWRRKITIHTKYGKFDTYKRLDEFLKLSLAKNFLKIHKSFAINKKHITGYHYEYIVVSNGEKLYISRNHQKNVSESILETGLF